MIANNRKPDALRLTIVNIQVPFWRRVLALFRGELVLAIHGTVREVAVISRSDGQLLLARSHEAKWLPFQSPDADVAPTKGPSLG